MHSLRRACVLALGPALVLGAGVPAAFAGPGSLPAAGTTVASDPVQPGVWGSAAEVAAAGEAAVGLHTRADGALIGLRGRATDPAGTGEGARTLTVMLRPAGGTAWVTRQLTTNAYAALTALSPQGDGSFVASWLEQQDGGQYLLKAATLAPGATTWSAVTTVTTLGSSVIAPRVFGSATGRLVAVWGEDPQNGSIQLRITERATPGGDWSQPRIFDSVKDTGDGDSGGEWYLTGLSGTVDKDGNAAVVWNLDDMQRDAPHARSPKDSAPAAGAAGTAALPIEYHSRIMELPAGASEWGQAKEPAALVGTGPGWLRLDAHPAGGFTLVWNHIGYHEADQAIRYSRKPALGADWTAPEVTSLAGTNAPRTLPRPLVGPNGDVTLVAASYDAKRVLSTTRDAATGTWSLAQADDRYPHQGTVGAGIAADGTVHAGWTVYRSNGSYSYVHAFRSRDGWSAPKALTTTPAAQYANVVTGVLAVSGSRPAALWSSYKSPLYAASGTTRPTPRFRDFSDDRRADLLSLTGDTLTRYEGDGAGHLTRGSLHTGSVTTGWAAGTRFTAFGDLNGDRLNDVLAVLPGGEARMYRTPAGRLPAPTSPYTKTGADWRGYDVLTAPGDLTGDGRADLLAREKATGNLWLYAGNGSAGFAARVRIGPGWNAYTKVVGAGDLNGDGHGDVLARDAHGELWRYYGTGTGKLGTRALVFRDWGSTYKQVIGAGDLNGDGRADLFSKDSAGVGWLNPGTGRGTFGNRVKVSSTWATRTVS
ncbi:FG-GAP repeat domain-containing protein [Streptomyces sp. NPDC086023]|uniref:FG-GAP repeat domain-containing protein n=1 Tax=Streptomyces sp. NPDC086023 TaxID=3365746 RepID=UPI0037CD127B